MRRLVLLLALLLVAAPVAAQQIPAASIHFGSGTGPLDTSGTGSPENVVTGCPGSTFRQTDGTSGNVFWVKDGGTGCDDTGWVILAGGGGGGSHNLLSATHSDTAANAAVRGAIIVANSTPAWSRVAIGSSGTFLRSNGTDPSWSADGSTLTALNGSNIASGTVPDARLSGNVSLLGSSISSSEITDGTIVFADWASNGCATDEIPKYDGAVWQCAADESSAGGGADAAASYLTRTSESGLSNESNLGALTTGLLKITVGGGTATPSTGAAGTDYVAPGAITSSGLTQATSRLLGRTTASSGAVEEISAGAGLSLSAGSLATSGAYTANGFTMATSRLLGRTTASTGAAEEISVGSGLSLSGGSLTATGTGGANSDRLVGITIDNGATAITTGVAGFTMSAIAGTITQSTLLSADASATACSIGITVKKNACSPSAGACSGYPPSSSIVASAHPTLSTASSAVDSTLTGWSTGVSANDIFSFTVDGSPTPTCTKVVLMLTVTP